MNVDPNNIIRIELVQDKAVLWKFDINYTLPDHLAQARFSLDSYLFRYIQHFSQDNPILKMVKFQQERLDKLQDHHSRISNEVDALIEKRDLILREKNRLEQEVMAIIQSEGNRYKVEAKEVEQSWTTERDMYKEHVKRINERCPKWIKYILKRWYNLAV